MIFLLEKPLIKEDILEKKFVKETQTIKSLLLSVKAKFDQIDSTPLSFEDQINFIENNKKEIFSALDKHFEKIFSIIKGVSECDYRAHQKYYQNQLLPLLCISPLNKRIYEKPLGYDGDYITMSYYYEGGCEGKALFERLINQYTLSIPIAKAVKNRLQYYCRQMNFIISKFGGPVLISSIGCGPAKEVIEFVRSNPLADRCIFNCLDSEKQALEYVKDKIGEIEKERGKKIKINYFNHNILQFIKKAKKGVYPSGQHLIYSSGLFDYLNNKIAARLIKEMFSLLGEGGILIVTNLHRNISSRAYLELLGEWYLILRNEKDMYELTSGIDGIKEKRIEIDEAKSQLFLILEK